MAKSLLIAALAASALCTANAFRSVGHPNHLIFEKGQEVVAAAAEPAGYWTDLFVAPYADCPKIITGISCLNRTHCYVAAGEDGTGFSVYEFDGSQGGEFNRMDMPSGPMMVMAVSVGSGKDGVPRGVAGGMGFGNSLQYLSAQPQRSVWLSSNFSADAPPLFPTQSIRTCPGGRHVLAVVEASMSPDPVVLFSDTAGVNFTTHRITNVDRIVKTSGLRYAAMPSPSTWYVTSGTEPKEPETRRPMGSDAAASSPLTGAFSVVVDKKTGKMSVEEEVRSAAHRRPPTLKSSAGGEAPVGEYSAQIFRTVDGGKTFTSVHVNIGDYCLHNIDCFDEKTCYVAGFGDNGGLILATNNGGESWRKVYEIPATPDQHLTLFTLSVSRFDGSIVAGGGWRGPSGFESFLISSTDGSEWVRQVGPRGVREISSISLLPGGYGFATAITVSRATTVLALRPNGTPTLPPQPTFSQVSCLDEKCQELCMAVAFPQNKCLRVQGSGSTIVHCDMARDRLVQLYYPDSASCSGNVTERTMPLHVCLEATSGGYFENVCKY